MSIGQADYGAVSALGTAAEPVVLTSAAPVPAPGDWVGLYIGYYDLSTTFQHAEISYGGASLPGMVYANACPTSTPSFDQTTIAYSSSWGVHADGACSPTLTNMTYVGNVSGDVF